MVTRRVSLVILLATVCIVTSNTQAQLVCQRAPAPIMITGAITGADGQQTGRISRDGVPSTCTASANGVENATPIHRDAYGFTNPFNETVCVRVEQDFSGCGGNQTMSEAYANYNPAAPGTSVIGDPGFSTINRGSYDFSVGPNANFTIVVHEVDSNLGCPAYNLKVTYFRNCRQAGFDRTNDGRADPTVYRTSASSQWYSLDSSSNDVIARQFGTVGDVVTGGSDYTGDGRTDLSVYRTALNTWYYGLDQDNPSINFQTVPFGTTGDRAVPGDYDGDGLNDVALWRSSDQNYYVLRSSDGTFQTFHWGLGTDSPVFGDFDGDTVTDFAVVRPGAQGSFWHIQKSNYNYGFTQSIQWGLPTDKLVPADYDGDSITDLAVWRPSEGVFYVRRSSDQVIQAFPWGTQNDTPQPADYDGDRKADFAVYRSSVNQWYIYYSSTGTIRVISFGTTNDIPVTSAYRIQ